MSDSLRAGVGLRDSLGRMAVCEVAYYLAFCLYFIDCVFDHSTFTEFLFVPVPALQSVLQFCILMLLFFKFISQRASFKGWCIAAFVVLVAFISWRRSGEGWLFWCALFVVCAHGVRLRPLAWCAFVLSAATFLLTVCFAYFGVIDNFVGVRAGVTRYSMGFTHPNYFGLFLLIICFSFSVLRFGKNPLPDILLIAVTDALNLAVADSRTCVMLSLVQVVLLLVFYFVRSESSRRLMRRVFAAGVLLVVALSMYFMVAYDPSNPVHLALDSALSGRLRLAHGYFQMQPFTLLGSTFEQFSPIYWENGRPYAFVVDNAWCHLILRYGLVPAALFSCGFFAMLFKLLNERRWDALLFGFVLMSVYGFSETLGIRIECNYFLFAMGAELLFASRFGRELSGEKNRGRAEVLGAAA